ncbi:hypothetical protein AcW1_008098 [Taiwanofungus camphoratus]|nr:hypothetical protein AcV5_008397 [Antrodia cinnamomea]KAI0950918.1 hypothetical protein AcW1_008098 [Antrodia cinnamomea]
MHYMLPLFYDTVHKANAGIDTERRSSRVQAHGGHGGQTFYREFEAKKLQSYDHCTLDEYNICAVKANSISSEGTGFLPLQTNLF